MDVPDAPPPPELAEDEIVALEVDDVDVRGIVDDLARDTIDQSRETPATTTAHAAADDVAADDDAAEDTDDEAGAATDAGLRGSRSGRFARGFGRRRSGRHLREALRGVTVRPIAAPWAPR